MVKQKYAIDLAKDYDFKTEDEYFNYIVDSLINGQRQQVKDLFNAMHNDSKRHFLVNYLEVSTGIQKSCLNICIGELCS